MKLKKLLFSFSMWFCALSFLCFLVVFIVGLHQKRFIIEKSQKSLLERNHMIVCDTISGLSPLEIIVLKGDKEAYHYLIKSYEAANCKDETFIHSIVMAFKYNYHAAYLNLFDNFDSLYGKHSLDSLDDYTKGIAIKCLKKSAELGNIKAKEEMVIRGL